MKKEEKLRLDLLVLASEAKYLHRMVVSTTSMAALGPILKGLWLLLH